MLMMVSDCLASRWSCKGSVCVIRCRCRSNRSRQSHTDQPPHPQSQQAPHDPKRLRQETLQAAALYFAAGIDPSKSTVFVQSHVRAHTELTWLLNCITPMNWLERMIQFKEKAVKQVRRREGNTSKGVNPSTQPTAIPTPLNPSTNHAG